MSSLGLLFLGGPRNGEEIVLREGQSYVCGREESAGIPLSWDAMVSRHHCRIEAGPEGWLLEDQGSRNGTHLNGEQIASRLLRQEDVLQIGETAMLVRYPATPTPQQRLITLLRSNGPLFALLDAARDREIPVLLERSGVEYRALFGEHRVEELREVAPYLAELPKKSTLLETLVYQGWGNAWGIFMQSQAPLMELRQHLRKRLLVELEGEADRTYYFRYYDPRVLREWVGLCRAEQARMFFGPVTSIFVESGKDHSVVRARLKDGGVEANLVVNRA